MNFDYLSKPIKTVGKFVFAVIFVTLVYFEIQADRDLFFGPKPEPLALDNGSGAQAPPSAPAVSQPPPSSPTVPQATPSAPVSQAPPSASVSPPPQTPASPAQTVSMNISGISSDGAAFTVAFKPMLNGQPVQGVRKDDLQLTIDGKPAAITGFAPAPGGGYTVSCDIRGYGGKTVNVSLALNSPQYTGASYFQYSVAGPAAAGGEPKPPQSAGGKKPALKPAAQTTESLPAIKILNTQKILSNNIYYTDAQLAAAPAGLPGGPGGYVLPLSGSVFLSKDYLSSMDPNLLRYARNEIFARHGLVFGKAAYRNYFSAKNWYKPVPSYSGDFSALSYVEAKNAMTIKALEISIFGTRG